MSFKAPKAVFGERALCLDPVDSTYLYHESTVYLPTYPIVIPPFLSYCTPG